MLERVKNELFNQLGYDIIDSTLLEEKALYNSAKIAFNRFFAIFPLKHNYVLDNVTPSIIPYSAIIADIIQNTITAKNKTTQQRVVVNINSYEGKDGFSIIQLDDAYGLNTGDLIKLKDNDEIKIVIANLEKNEIIVEKSFDETQINELINSRCDITQYNIFERNHCKLMSRLRIGDSNNGMIMNPLNQLILGINATTSSSFSSKGTGSLAYNYTLLRLFGTMYSRMSGDYETYFDDYSKQVKIIYPTMASTPIVLEFQYGYEIQDLFTIDEINNKINLNQQEVKLFEFINQKNYRVFHLMTAEKFLQSLIMSRSQVELHNDESFSIPTETLKNMLEKIQAELERALSFTTTIPLVFG